MSRSQIASDSLPRRLSLLAELGGPEGLGVYAGYYVTDALALTVGVGLNFDAHLGMQLYFGGHTRSAHSVYAGAHFVICNQYVLAGPAGDRQGGVFIPLGYEYLARGGFTLQVEVGPNFVGTHWSQVNTRRILASIRLGKTWRALISNR